MSIASGARIGSYEVGEQIGAGGMGHVFRARDLNLGRAVAIKLLPPSFSADAERAARFEREAQMLAALNHPNIAQVFGFEKGGAAAALIMELVEGPTLADRIAAGPLAIDEACSIAAQIADALESAHDQGIIHRDLKPANVKVRTDGTVKVLDFGLAKALQPADALPLADSPTITSPAMTAAGTILGTAAYMSPEQARGRVVDRRADIWAFGCVLFEMLTGRRAFRGADVSEVSASILRDSPPWALLPAATPPRVRVLLERCLEKDLKKRLPHIGVARLDLLEPSGDAARPGRGRGWALLGGAAIGAVLVAVLAAAWNSRAAAPPSAQPILLQADLGLPRPLQLTSSIALAADGSALAFVGQDPSVRAVLHIRRLSALNAEPLAGTEGAQAPFFSPDGRSVAFFADGLLKKVPAGGGRVSVITDAATPRGGWWADDNTILFATGSGLHRVGADDGTRTTIAAVAPNEMAPAWPQLLPGGRHVLYTDVWSGNTSGAAVYIRSLDGGPPGDAIATGGYPRYVSSGHLTFIRGNMMLAAPFDLGRMRLLSDPVAVIEGIAQTTSSNIMVAAVSTSGALVYQRIASMVLRTAPLVWMHRTGPLQPLMEEPARWALPRFSPDGRRVAMSIHDGRQHDIWVYDWERDTRTRITSHDGSDLAPVWTPDGAALVFGSNRDGSVANLYWQRADGTGQAQRLTTSTVPQLPDDFDREGRVIFHQGDPFTRRQDLMMLALQAPAGAPQPGPITPVVTGPFLKANARISPDGKWIAYSANDTGAFEIYVQPYPGPGPRIQISSDGGALPAWSPNTRELYFAGAARMMVVSYSIAGGAFTATRERQWSETRFSPIPPIDTYGPGFDLHPDGTRFAAAPPIALVERYPVLRLVFSTHFADELRRLAPRP